MKKNSMILMNVVFVMSFASAAFAETRVGENTGAACPAISSEVAASPDTAPAGQAPRDQRTSEEG